MSQALQARLAQLAAQGQTITYGALARDLGLRMASLTAALEALMEADASAGLPLRAALCRGRLLADLPAPGFYLKAAQLGYEWSDPARFVAELREALHGRPPSGQLPA